MGLQNVSKEIQLKPLLELLIETDTICQRFHACAFHASFKVCSKKKKEKKKTGLQGVRILF